MSSSPIAFCASPTFQTSRLTDSAGMKRHFGARPLESCTRSKHWIAASPKREGTLLGLEQKLKSIANNRCLRDRADSASSQVERGSFQVVDSHNNTRHRGASVYFASSLTPLFLKKRRHEPWHSCIKLSWPTYNVHVAQFGLLLSSNMTHDPT